MTSRPPRNRERRQGAGATEKPSTAEDPVPDGTKPAEKPAAAKAKTSASKTKTKKRQRSDQLQLVDELECLRAEV